MKLTDVMAELVEERGLDRDTLSSIVCEGMLAAYERRYPNLKLKVQECTSQEDLVILVQKAVVATVEDELSQISLKKARNIDPKVVLGDEVWVPFEGKVGRIEILKARQVIASKIKSIETLAIYNDFKPKLGQIVIGTIHKCERNGVSVKLSTDVLAFLPNAFLIPGEKCIVGYSIRALLKEVLQEPRGDYQLILDRASPEFLYNLFLLEIPEVFEKLVEVKKIVRAPGYKAKVAVASNDRNIDPVGTCVGIGGSRIKPILKELAGEKVDVFSWSDSVEALVKNALKPAVVDRVELVDDKSARVFLDEDQRSFAIGKNGQNIALAAQLTGISIQLVRESGAQQREAKDDKVIKSKNQDEEEF